MENPNKLSKVMYLCALVTKLIFCTLKVVIAPFWCYWTPFQRFLQPFHAILSFSDLILRCFFLQEAPKERRAHWRAHVQGRGVIRGEIVYAVWTAITIVIFQHSFYYIQSRYHWIIAEINVLQSKSFPATSEYCKNLDESHRKLMYHQSF